MARKSRKNSVDSTEKIKFKVYKTAIYARLSAENHNGEKIETQIEEIRNYMENRRIFELIDIYSDNGYSGTNFQRGAEDYLNNIFPFLGVRFIAINDGYDNLNIEPQEYFMTAFKNLAHEYFARETSRKVIAAKRELQKQGKFIGSKPAFGYQRDPDDKHKLIINEENAKIIREIFQRIVDNETTVQVAKSLNQYGINWNHNKICTVLKKEIYKGILIQHQTERSFYKDEEFHRIPKSEQFRFENIVPAIVSSELWEKANAVIAERQRKKHDGVPENPYKNLVFCGKCQKKVSISFQRRHWDFVFNCERCRNGVFSSGKNMNQMVRNHLKLPENTEITKDLLNEKLEKIIIFERKNIILIDRGDNE